MSVIKHKNQRVGIFIDAQNLYHCAKNLYGAKVNFGQVVNGAQRVGRSCKNKIELLAARIEEGEHLHFQHFTMGNF